MNIKPVNDLKDYSQVLSEVRPNKPVYLTENGDGKYLIINIEDAQKFLAVEEFLGRLQQAKNLDDISLEELRNQLNK